MCSIMYMFTCILQGGIDGKIGRLSYTGNVIIKRPLMNNYMLINYEQRKNPERFFRLFYQLTVGLAA